MFDSFELAVIYEALRKYDNSSTFTWNEEVIKISELKEKVKGIGLPSLNK